MPRVFGFTTSAFDPASRVRFIQFIPHLKKLGWEVEHRPNVPDRQWSSSLKYRVPRALAHRAGRMLMRYNRLRDTRHAASADVVFVNRDLAGNGLFFERRLLRGNPKVVFDFDDAIFLGRNEPAVRWMCQNAACVTPGNEYLAEYARRHSKRVVVVPTVIDTDTYSVRKNRHEEQPLIRVGWSGSDQSIAWTLFPFLPMFRDLQKTLPFELVVMTNSRPKLSVEGIRWSFVPWSVEAEMNICSYMDIGIMPLVDQEFQRGKCGLKLLQYMAAGLPTIASPIGVNCQITEQENTGFLAKTQTDWADALKALLASPERRLQLGLSGRERCVRNYSIERWLPIIHGIFMRLLQNDISTL